MARRKCDECGCERLRLQTLDNGGVRPMFVCTRCYQLACVEGGALDAVRLGDMGEASIARAVASLRGEGG